jgi:hypothetical protein
MPTRTRIPDLPALPAQDISAAAGSPGQDDVAGEPAWAGLRLVTVPAGWPPYDCETHGAACSAATPQADRPPPRPATAGEATVAWNAIPAGPRTTAGVKPAEAEAGRTAGLGRPPELSAAWPRQFAQVLVEILAGLRPAKQLAPWATERVRAQIDLLSRAVAEEQRPRIRRVMTSRPAADVVEMTMVVGFGSRSRALAIRFEHVPARAPVPGRPARPARWLCTEIETS